MFSRFISTTARRSAGVARKCLDWSFHFGFVLPPLSFVCPLPLLSALLFPFPSQKFCPIHPLLLRTHGHRTAANDTQRGILLNLWACSHPALFSRSTIAHTGSTTRNMATASAQRTPVAIAPMAAAFAGLGASALAYYNSVSSGPAHVSRTAIACTLVFLLARGLEFVL